MEPGRQQVGSGGEFEARYGYSRAVRVGRHIHVAGTTARPPDTDRDAYRQATSALAIIAAALESVGSSIDDVVRTVIYVTDVDDAPAVLRAHREMFDAIRPAVTLVAVHGLMGANTKVEIEAYAIAPAEQHRAGE